MTDLDDRLRAYGRDADQAVTPVTLSELRDRAPSTPTPVDSVGSDHRTRRWRIVGFAAASVLAIVAIAAVTRGPSLTVTDRPDSTGPDDELVELPTPGPERFVHETSVGTIKWNRLIGDESELPELVTGRDGAGALIGRDRDGSLTWRSTDGGRSWGRTVTDGVRTSIDGVEWIARSDPSGSQAGELSYDDGTGERPLEVPEFRVGVEAPFTLDVTRIGDDDGLPFDVAGRPVIAVVRTVQPDWATLTGDDDWSSVSVESGAMTRSVVRDGAGSRSYDYTVESTTAGASLIDRDGTAVLTIDGVPGFDDVDPAQILGGGASRTELFEFTAGELRPLQVPWPDGPTVVVGEVDGGLFAYQLAQPGVALTPWFSVDGAAWTTVDLPIDATVEDGSAYINPGFDGGWVLVDGSGPTRHWATTDGRTFEPIPPAPDGMRSGGDFGWVNVQNFDQPRLTVSTDGVDWERVDIRELLEIGDGISVDFLEFRAIGDSIFLTGIEDGRRLLLVGTVDPG